MVVALVSMVGCEDPFSIRAGDFYVVQEEGAFVVRNRSETLDAVHIIIETERSALFDPVSCEAWEPRLPPGEDDVVPHDAVFGYHPGAESVLVLWCLLHGDRAVDQGSFSLPIL